MAWLEDRLTRLEGRTFSFKELRREILDIRVEALSILPPDMSAKHLMQHCVDRGWIKDGPFPGTLEVIVRKSSE